MKKNAKLIALVATILALALASTLAMAQPPQQGPRDGRGKGPLFHCLRIVNLTEDQQAQVKGILEAAQPTIQAAREDIRAQKEALKALLDADDVDECAVGAAVVGIQESKQALREEMEKVLENIKLVLTPEQASKLDGCLEAARDDFPGRGNGPNGPGIGPGTGSGHGPGPGGS